MLSIFSFWKKKTLNADEFIKKNIEWGRKYLVDMKAVNRLMKGSIIKRKFWLPYYWLRNIKESICGKIPSVDFVCTAWIKGIGGLWIDLDPVPDLKKIEFEKWSEEKEVSGDILGLTFSIELRKR